VYVWHCDREGRYSMHSEGGYEQSMQSLSQLSLAGDNAFDDGGGALQIATVTGTVSTGYTVKRTVGVDTATTRTADD
jgi:protocatechuate 3,4-dioxygenase beta subunit